MATLDSIDARLIALEVSLERRFEDNRRDHDEIKAALALVNGTVRCHDRGIAALQEQQRAARGFQAALSLVAAAVAGVVGWLR